MAAHGAFSSPGSAAAGLLQRVEVSGFRLLRRASATQQKCRKIQAPKGLREMAAGRTANVNFLLVFTGQNGPPIQKPIVKSLILEVASPRGGRAGLQAGCRGRRKQGPGGEARRQSPAGAPGRTANVNFLLVFTGQSGATIQKLTVKSPVFRTGATPNIMHVCLPCTMIGSQSQHRALACPHHPRSLDDQDFDRTVITIIPT